MKKIMFMITLICSVVSLTLVCAESRKNPVGNKKAQKREERRRSVHDLVHSLNAWKDSAREFVQQKFPLPAQPSSN